MKHIFVFLLFWLCGWQNMMGQSWIDQLRNADQQESQGHWQEAAELYTVAINTTPDETAKVECLQHRASCYKRLDAYDRAQTDYETALGLAKDSALRAVVGYNMSDLLIQTGQYDRAISLLKSFRFASLAQDYRRLANLATAYAYSGQGDKALAMLDDIISHSTTDTTTHALLLQNRGFLLWDKHEYARALQDIQSALPHLQGNTHYIALANMALVEAELNMFDQALQHINQVIAWQAQAPGIGPHHSTYLISLRKKAEILLKAQRLSEAAAVYKTYFKAEHEYVCDNFAKMSEQSRLDFWLKENPLVSEMFALGQQEAAFLYDVALFRRNIALMGDPTARQQDRLKALLAHNRNLVATKLQPQEATIELVCFQHILTGDSVYAALICTKTGAKYVNIASKKDLHGYPIANTTLEQAVCQGARYAKMVYTDSVLAAKIWAPLRQALPATVKRVFFAPEGLFQMLGIEYLPYPAMKGIDLRRVSSTDRIHTSQPPVNGKTLVVGGLDYSKEDLRQIANPTSTKANHTAYDKALRLCGGPLSFKNLPATIPEADTVAHLLGTQYDRLMWEDELKQSIGKYQIVHLATHGYSLRVALGTPSVFLRDSLRHDNSLWASGIALTGANVEGRKNGAEDGLFSARELSALDLSGVRFITLSACQTAQGIVSDEGPAGMLRALKKAGAGTIIASLWAVNDKSTRLFMKAFYQAWRLERKDIHTAFHQAQQALQQYAIPQVQRALPTALHRSATTAQPQLIHPYQSPQYWAPFILID